MSVSERRAASLAERYRPRAWPDVLGHADAVAFLRDQAARAKDEDDDLAGGRSVLIVGPPGSGKSSLAELYGRAIHCSELGGDPCGQCSDCESWRTRTHHNLRLLNGQYGGPSFASDVSSEVENEYDGRGRLVILIDEGELLTPAAWGLLHDRMERPPANVTFIVCATKTESVPERHRDLFRRIEVRELCVADREALIRKVCTLEGVEIEEAGIVALAKWGGGRARKLLNLLETLAHQGPVSETGVRSLFHSPLTGVGLKYVESVLRREPLSEQMRILDEASLSVEGVAELVHSVLGALLGAPALNLADEQLRLVHAEAAARLDLANALLGRGDELQLTPRAMFTRLMGWWREPIRTRAGLIERVNAFDEFLNGAGSVMSATSADAPARRRRTPAELRSLVGERAPSVRRRARSRASEQWLADVDVQRVWDAGSFLIQKFGLYLDRRLSLRFESAGDEAASAAITELLSQMRMWANRHWRTSSMKEPLHWVRVHSRDEAGARWAHIVLSAPKEANLERWLTRYRRQTRRPLDIATKVELDLPHRAADLERHWDLLCVVLEGCDPSWTIMREDEERIGKVPVHRLLGVEAPRQSGRHWGKQRIFVSRYIDGAYRQRAAEVLPFLSIFDERRVYAARWGWEPAEFEYRRSCEEEYKRLVEEFERDWARSGDALAERRNSEWRVLQEAWSARLNLRITARPGIRPAVHPKA